MSTPRKCTRCTEVKAIPGDFYTTGRDKNGVVRWKTWCKQCESEYQKIRRGVDDDFRKYHDRVSAEWQNENHGDYLKLLDGWRKSNPAYWQHRPKRSLQAILRATKPLMKKVELDRLIERDRILMEKRNAQTIT